MITPESLNTVIVVTMGNAKAPHTIGLMVGYSDRPTAWIDTGDGDTETWVASLCRPATTTEAETFWRERALAAEAALKANRS
ncbi:MAG: hypothetical protein V4706_02770 [Pseudomonadota bacterium]